MGALHRFLGLSGRHHRRTASRRPCSASDSYNADVTYVHEQRAGLRLPARQHEVHHREKYAAEAAATTRSSTRWTRSSSTRPARPLIISGPRSESTAALRHRRPHDSEADAGHPRARSRSIEETGDFWVDEKAHQRHPDRGGRTSKVEQHARRRAISTIPASCRVLHAVNQAPAWPTP